MSIGKEVEKVHVVFAGATDLFLDIDLHGRTHPYPAYPLVP